MHLFWIVHVFVGAVFVGSAVTVALVLGLNTLPPILVAIAIGFAAAMPVSWIVAKKMSS